MKSLATAASTMPRSGIRVILDLALQIPDAITWKSDNQIFRLQVTFRKQPTWQLARVLQDMPQRWIVNAA